MNMYTGVITSWKHDRGFGFITPRTGGKRIFVHISDIQDKERPAIGLVVNYALSKDKKGRECAVKVELAPTAQNVGGIPDVPSASTAQRVYAPSILGALFLLAVALLAVMGKVPGLLLPFFTAMSILSFGLYAKDKNAARTGKWRVSEKILHISSLLGGWVGAGLAQNMLRHKTAKKSFQIMYWITVLGNIVLVALLLTPEGTQKAALIVKRFIQYL